MSARLAQSYLVLMAIVLALTVAGGVWLWHQQHAINEVQQATSVSKCADLSRLAAIPIPTPVAGNPSRQFAAAEETIWRDRARQLGCPIAKGRQ
jgi:uncharacterized protein HemX